MAVRDVPDIFTLWQHTPRCERSRTSPQLSNMVPLDGICNSGCRRILGGEGPPTQGVAEESPELGQTLEMCLLSWWIFRNRSGRSPKYEVHTDAILDVVPGFFGPAVHDIPDLAPEPKIFSDGVVHAEAEVIGESRVVGGRAIEGDPTYAGHNEGDRHVGWEEMVEEIEVITIDVGVGFHSGAICPDVITHQFGAESVSEIVTETSSVCRPRFKMLLAIESVTSHKWG